MQRTFLVTCQLIGAAATASAAPLRILTDERSVASFGSATTFTDRIFYDGTPTETTVVTDAKVRAPIGYTATTRTRSFNAADGMSLRTPLASVDGQGAQTSSFSTTGIRFSGVADGGASSSARWTFSLSGVQPMQLSMTSSLSVDDLSGFTFSPTSDNGFSWTTPYVSGAEGAVFTFITGFKLRPGT